MAQKAIVTAAALVIGDEILSGRTKDKNIGAIAEHLTAIGIQMREVRVVGDAEAEIVAALNALRSRYDYVFTTGGIGPTHDDITADCVAKAFGASIDVDAEARALLQGYYQQRGLELTPARLRMARVPAGATLIKNEVSGAPGFRIGNVIVMAGVPDIMAGMLRAVSPTLHTGDKVQSVTVTALRPESEIAERLEAVQRQFPDVAMGSYPRLLDGKPIADLVLRSSACERLEQARLALEEALASP